MDVKCPKFVSASALSASAVTGEPFSFIPPASHPTRSDGTLPSPKFSESSGAEVQQKFSAGEAVRQFSELSVYRTLDAWHESPQNTHEPQLLVGEVPAEVPRVELVGAGELAEHVHRSAREPVRAESDRDAEAIELGDARRLTVEADVRARRPDELGAPLGHQRDVLRREADAVDDRG